VLRPTYPDYMIAPAEALALILDEAQASRPDPDVCRHHDVQFARNCAMPGDLVALLGIGWHGHLGVQFVVKMVSRLSRSEGPIRCGWPGSSGCAERPGHRRQDEHPSDCFARSSQSRAQPSVNHVIAFPRRCNDGR
jgi:hypothetical protein